MIEFAKTDPHGFWQTVGETMLQFGLKVLAALLLYIVGMWLISLLKRGLQRGQAAIRGLRIADDQAALRCNPRSTQVGAKLSSQPTANTHGIRGPVGKLHYDARLRHDVATPSPE